MFGLVKNSHTSQMLKKKKNVTLTVEVQDSGLQKVQKGLYWMIPYFFRSTVR